ncbi:MAG: hypothetical protein WBB73_06095 [Candidatus Aminicenantaceae bacterium]
MCPPRCLQKIASILISSTHHFADPVPLQRRARKVLKPDGRLAIVEWLPWSESDHQEGTEPAALCL